MTDKDFSIFSEFLCRCLFDAVAEANSVRQYRRSLDSVAHRRMVRRSVFRIQSEIDQIQQTLDEITYHLNDIESNDLEFSDHDQKVANDI